MFKAILSILVINLSLKLEIQNSKRLQFLKEIELYCVYITAKTKIYNKKKLTVFLIIVMKV